MMYRSFFFLLLFHACHSLQAQTYIGLREIVNYEKQQYNAGSQNWDIRQDVQGRMYFANNEGLLTFDGVYWKLFPLPNKTIVRSIEFGHDKRIYIGAQDEIGYFSPDKSNKLTYTSLKDLLPEKDQQFADIWDIVRYREEIFFRSNNKIFRYTGNRIDVFAPATAWLFMGLYNDQLIAQDEQNGIYVFTSGQWKPLIGEQLLPPGFTIIATTCLSKDSCLVITSRNGLYILSGNKLHPFALSGIPMDPYQDFTGVAPIDENHFIVSTYNNGFYLLDNKGIVLENFSKKEGLQNANIRSVFKDRNHNIWLGLDSGIDFIAFNNAIKHINPPVMNDGSGYAVLIHNNYIFFGLSNGIYQLPLPAIKDLSYAKNNITLMMGGQTWGLYNINNKLLAGTDEGFLQIDDHSVKPVLKSTGFWVFVPVQQNQPNPLIAAGNYHGVRLFEYNHHQFTDKGSLPNFAESARFLVADNNNTLWVSHPYRGVYRIRLSANNDTPVKLYTAANGLPSSLENHVYKIKNRIVIATAKGVYEYNHARDRFEPSADFKEIFGESSVRYLKEDPSGNIWFVQEKSVGVVDLSTLKPSIIYLPELKGKIMSGFEHIYPVDDNNIFVGGEKGFYHINFEKYKQNNHPLNVYIRSVKSIGRTDSVLFGGYSGLVNEDKQQSNNDMPSVSHQWNSFHIEYSSPLFEQQSKIEYSYYLEGFNKGWSEWSGKTEKDYTNLPAGAYTFQVKARNNLRSESLISKYSFFVLPPWYQTKWAYIGYVLLSIGLAWLLYRIQHKKLIRERQKHQEEQQQLAYLHQLELEKSEKEMVKLRNEKLESDIEFKNTELASTAMHLVQKEEFILKIKEELQHLDKNGKEKTEPGELKKILRFLSEEEKLNTEWEQFSVHFDKVHGNFLIKLKDRYPGLRPHELKLCAYLRMNLSSKEIARLMSISVRGVEISRYRLRKKLEIPTEINLFQFLFDLHRNEFRN